MKAKSLNPPRKERYRGESFRVLDRRKPWTAALAATLLILSGSAPSLLAAPSGTSAGGHDIPVVFTFDHDHTDINRIPTGAGPNELRGDPEDALAGVSYTDGGKILAQVGRNRNISLYGNTSSKTTSGSTVFLDLSAAFGCADAGGTSVHVDIDTLPGCDPCLNTVPLLPDERFGSLVGADSAGLPDNFTLDIAGEDYDDLRVGDTVDTWAHLQFDIGVDTWVLYWGPYRHPGGWTYDPDSSPVRVTRVSSSEWRFQTTGDHRAALYRRVDNQTGRATEYHGQFQVKFSGTAVAISDPGDPANPIDDIQVNLGDPACGSPTVTIDSPADGSTFASGATVPFTGTATDAMGADISDMINWFLDAQTTAFGSGPAASLAIGDGVHTITAQATDANGTGSDAVTITVGTPAVPSTVSVTSISYSTAAHGKHLRITPSLHNDLGDPVSGASVSIELDLDGSPVTSATGTTGADGTVTFQESNAPAGTYTTKVTDVMAAGLTWDGATPENSFTK